MSNISSDDLDDNDRTDELPVLLETVVLEDPGDDAMPTARVEDTSEHTAVHQAIAAQDSGSAQPQTEWEERASRVAALEAHSATLTHRLQELDAQLGEKDRLITELRQQAQALRASAEDKSAAERHLATQLTARDARIAELTAAIEGLEAAARTRAAELDRLRQTAEAEQREVDSLRSELAAQQARDTAASDVQRLLEDKAALEGYIATRRVWWEGLQAKQAEQTAAIAALQQELAAGSKRLRDAEAFAAQESSRAMALRAELVDYARRVETLQRELRASRALEAAPESGAVDRSPRPLVVAPPTNSMTPRHPAAPPARELAAPEPTGGGAPTVDAIAQLEAEVEYKRQQVAAQLVELKDREQQLRTGASELDRARRELATARSELDENRSAVARLERAVIDKDRALEARDARIATLQEEIKQRVGPPETSTAADLQPSRQAATSQPNTLDATNENSAAPTLVCLTGDAPKRVALTKRTLTIGRGPHCDLQILTHFVSREHARITLNGGHVLIEDVGSRNGVFVNSVRVDRQALQQGDLITIGDTQFRFVESMAH